MHLDQFNYQLPENLIAQNPLQNRTDSRLLIVGDRPGVVEDSRFGAVAELINPGDLLVVNDTRVLPARVWGVKPTGGKVEIMLERILDSETALVMLRANKSVKTGQQIVVDELEIKVIQRQDRFFVISLTKGSTISDIFENHGDIPLPPYINRSTEAEDSERYQTVYSHNPGAVAAPTAGLHFDHELLSLLQNKGVAIEPVTLHVGAGTFTPVQVEDINDHQMHDEKIVITDQVCDKITTTKARGGRVIAVGTTVVRALESAAVCGQIKPMNGDTNLFITPGYQFNVVDRLITNFHLPKSTLLMMVCAFAGYDTVFAAYRHAIQNRYRFFSYGDAMFLRRNDGI